MIKYRLFLLGLFLWTGIALAQEQGGMWIPTELNESEMKEMGMKISAKDIFSSDSASIKDAIAHFGGGCTSEVISPKGLLLTNHHCGYSQIQKHSSVDHDYLKDGFWAENQDKELKNKGLTATFTIAIKDVTDDILKGIKESTSEDNRRELIKINKEMLKEKVDIKSYQDVSIRPFYKGNKYYLFITETYKDVRLVGAPPSSIGKFGADTDNWSWPRHVGDFALFRIYADKDNKPAEYSPDNVPYTPKHYLPISNKGVEEDDFTFVFGFPGATDEYLLASALEQTLKIVNPARIGIRDVALKILDKKMRKDDATRIKYASKFAGISNYHKKWTGESQGLKNTHAVEKRKDLEKEFMKRVSEDSTLQKKYSHLLKEFDRLYKENEKYELTEIYFNEAIFQNSETFRTACLLQNLIEAQGHEGYKDLKKRYISYLKGLYKNYDPNLDQEVSLGLIDLYLKDVPKEFLPSTPLKFDKETFENSILTGKQKVNGVRLTEDLKKAFENDETLLSALEEDPLVVQIGEIQEIFEEKVGPKHKQIQDKISQLQRVYMKAQMEVFPDSKFFPDANSTLRVTYGKVDGYQPEGKSRYNAKTYLDGAVKKYIPDDYEFDMPKRLRKLQKKKKFGSYGEKVDGKKKMPVNFLATNHTTGGNSGSPTLDKDGNLIGLNFDRVWEDTMSDLNYDPELSRNIQVDARYILFIIDEFAGADYLLDEMDIIN